jgi:exodeoxyribonuclease VII large subunit
VQLRPILDAAIAGIMTLQRTRLQTATHALELLNPLNVLDRGYALVFNEAGQAVTDARTLNAGTALRIRVQQGQIEATVTKTNGE